jgi:hypothetical protein
MDRRQAVNIGPQRLEIGFGYLGVSVERHRRVEKGAVGADAVVQRVAEIGKGPVADPGLRVRSYVCRIEDAKGRVDREAAGIRLCPVAGVAWHAIRRPRQVLTLLYECRVFRR